MSRPKDPGFKHPAGSQYDVAEVQAEWPRADSPKHPWAEKDSVEPMSPRESVMRDAIALTVGNRDEEYGPPTQNMQEIGDLWSAYLQRQLSVPLTGAQVATMCALMKIARLMEQAKHDTYADACAYIGIAYECAVDAEIRATESYEKRSEMPH